MKKIVSLALVLLLCLGMTLTATATTGFIPSVSYDPSAFLISAEMDGKNVTDCIVITTVEEAIAKSTDITQEERDALLERYEAIKNGEKLPVDCEYVIIQLLDVNFKYMNCRIPEEHGDKPAWLAVPGNTITLKFNLGVSADAEVDVLKYCDDAWEHVHSVTNNGDGTVTVVYEHFCPNAFIIKNCSGDVPQTGDSNGAQLMLWGGVFGACVLGLIVVVIVFSRKRKHA